MVVQTWPDTAGYLDVSFCSLNRSPGFSSHDLSTIVSTMSSLHVPAKGNPFQLPQDILLIIFEHIVDTIGLKRSLQARLVSSMCSHFFPQANKVYLCSLSSAYESRKL